MLALWAIAMCGLSGVIWYHGGDNICGTIMFAAGFVITGLRK